MKTDLMFLLQSSQSRFEAAVAVRAIATQQAAKLYCYSSAQRISIIEQAEQLAEQLERDFAADEYGPPVPEDKHPWKRWLLEAGYPAIGGR